MKLPFATLDVFTDRRFAGNPLAVVFDADALDDARMQTIAREFGHPETVFVLKPEAGGTARVRIFTPAVELPFAGHPDGRHRAHSCAQRPRRRRQDRARGKDRPRPLHGGA